jgi:structural maintenance of chromosome 4
MGFEVSDLIVNCALSDRVPRSQSKPDAGDVSHISALENEIAAATVEFEVLQDKSSKISKAIKDLEQKILEIGGTCLLMQKSKVDSIKLHINLANDEITKAEVAKVKVEKDSAKLDTLIEVNKTALEEAKTELMNMNNQLGDLTGFVTELQGQIENVQAAVESLRDPEGCQRASSLASCLQIRAGRIFQIHLVEKRYNLQQHLHSFCLSHAKHRH